MNVAEINIEVDASGGGGNDFGVEQVVKKVSEPTVNDDYFHFELSCDGKSYSIGAKDKGTIPSIVTIPRTHRGLPVTEIKDWGFSQS